MSNTIIQTLNAVAYGGLEEGFITCESKQNQESVRVMTYNAKSKMNQVYRDILGITKTEENGKLFVRIYKKPMNEIWIRDKETGMLKPMESKPLNADLFIAAEHMRKAGVSADKIAEYIESNGEIIPEIVKHSKECVLPPEEIKQDFTKLLNTQEDSWKAEEKDVRKSEKELIKEMFCKGEDL